MSELVYVGIDVAKSSFQVAVKGEAVTLNLSNDEGGQDELCRLLIPLAPMLIVLEATGGYEQELALALAGAGGCGGPDGRGCCVCRCLFLMGLQANRMVCSSLSRCWASHGCGVHQTAQFPAQHLAGGRAR